VQSHLNFIDNERKLSKN